MCLCIDNITRKVELTGVKLKGDKIKWKIPWKIWKKWKRVAPGRQTYDF